jgi:hypothetical protein
MNIIPFIITLSYLIGTGFSIPIPFHSSQCSQIRNFALRAYIFTTKKQVKDSLINKIYRIADKSNATVNLLILDLNSKYSALSEEDKFLIDQILNIIF